MENDTLWADSQEIFSCQRKSGPFSDLALETACLNYLDSLNRVRRDPLAKAADRTKALHSEVRLENKLYRFIKKQTPISYFDSDFRQQTKHFIQLREIFLSAADFTFKRHRFEFLLDLLRLYRDDPCQILADRDIKREECEHRLAYDYLLLDMGQKNTESIGREAISNGYHECDYTLEIEEVWKQPMKAVPRSYFRYVKKALPDSQYARAIAAWMKDHTQELAPALWVVDTKAIEEIKKNGAPDEIKASDLAAIEKTFVR